MKNRNAMKPIEVSAEFEKPGKLGGIEFYMKKHIGGMGVVLRQRSRVLGSGQYFLAFFLFNLLFDVYLEYPEVLFPFFSFGLLLAAQARADTIGREGDAHHADLRESSSSE